MAGYVLPLAVAVVSIPRLLHTLGDDRFGLLTLFWVLAGYFNILDLGLGRALILAFSRLRPIVDRGPISSVFWMGCALLGALGFAMAFALQIAAEPLARLLGVAPGLHEEAVDALRIVGWTMPTTLILPALMALPTALQRQKGLAILRIPSGVASHLIPLVMVSWTHDLRDLMWANLVLRIVLLAVHFAYARMVHPIDWPPRDARATTRSLLSTSMWMMVTNLLAPLLMNLDRLLISHVSGTGALSSYAPAMDLATKMLMVVGVSLVVLFPALGHHLANDPEQANAVYGSTLRTIAWWAPPVVLLGAACTRPVVVLWLGASHGVLAGILLCVFMMGVLGGLPGQISFAAVQASGDARRASWVHALETPVYAGAIWFAARTGGVVAVAWVWASRHLVDSLAMHLLARRRGIRPPGDFAQFGIVAGGMALVGLVAVLHRDSAWAGSAAGAAAGLVWLVVAAALPSGRAAFPSFLRRFVPLPRRCRA